MTAAKKFMFDLVFETDADELHALPKLKAKDEPEVQPEEPPAPTFSQEEMDAARAEGHRRGREEAAREAASAVEKQILDTLAAVGRRLDELFQSEQQANAEREREAVAVALSIVRKLFPHLSGHHGANEVEALVRRALGELTEEALVTIRLHPDTAAHVRERVGSLAAEARFKGKIQFQQDEALERSDCRISWGAGGLARSTAEMWQKIDEIVEENLGPEGMPATTEPMAQEPTPQPTDAPQAADTGPATT